MKAEKSRFGGVGEQHKKPEPRVNSGWKRMLRKGQKGVLIGGREKGEAQLGNQKEKKNKV